MTAGDPDPRELYVAWRAQRPGRWYTVGRLTRTVGEYHFEYTRGFEIAQREAGMRTIFGFPDPQQSYRSSELFPLFTNRLMRPSRPDYGTFIQQLGLGADPDPLDILARSEGYRATDHFRVYVRPRPMPEPDGRRYQIVCFVAGLRFRSDRELDRAGRLAPGDALTLLAEPGNPEDADAHIVRTLDGVVLGYVPRYYAADLTQLEARGVPISITVQRNNIGRAPKHRALLCELDAPWPDDFDPPRTFEQASLPARGPAEGAAHAI